MDPLDQAIRKVSNDLRLRLEQDREDLAGLLAFPASAHASAKSGGIAEALKHIRRRFPEAVDQAVGYVLLELPKWGLDAPDVSPRLRDRLNSHLELLFDVIRFTSLPQEYRGAVDRQRDELEQMLQDRLGDFEDGGPVSASTIMAMAVSNPTHVAPASDRFVTLDHNSAEYGETIDALRRVQTALDQQNDFPDLEEKEQLAAELKAGLELLAATRVFADGVVAVLGRALIFLQVNYKTLALGVASSAAWDALKSLLGWSG